MKLSRLNDVLRCYPIFVHVVASQSTFEAKRMRLEEVEHDKENQLFRVRVKNLEVNKPFWYQEIGKQNGIRLWQEFFRDPMSSELVTSMNSMPHKLRGLHFDLIDVTA